MNIVGQHSQAVRHALNLSIDVSTPTTAYTATTIDTPSSARASIATTNSLFTTSSSTPTSASSWRICSVLCLYDFDSSDPDHLPFQKNEILEIVQKEDSGWWAALRTDRVGWIPSAFVQPLSDDMADVLRNVREELRIYEYHAESLYASSPTSNLGKLYDESTSSRTDITQTAPLAKRDAPRSPNHQDTPAGYSTDTESETSPSTAATSAEWSTRGYPPSPSTPMPQPPKVTKISPLMINKPTPPTPKTATMGGESFSRRMSLSRSQSDTAANILANGRPLHRRPTQQNMNGRPTGSVSQLRDLLESSGDQYDSGYDAGDGRSGATTSRTGKIRQLTGDDDAEAFHSAKVAQANLPWYLQPLHGGNKIQLQFNGNVNAGTVPALVERLLVDPLKLSQEIEYRHVFLTTFRTFSTADDLFDLLVDKYQLRPPPTLTETQMEEWKEKRLRPTQHRVLTVLTMWLEDHGMLQDDPHIAPQLRIFLNKITAPPPLQLTAQLMLGVLDRLSTTPVLPPPGPLSPPKRRKPKNDFLRMDPTDLAQQLTLLEYRLYSKIRPQECLNWGKVQKGESVKNLISFCATHDKLAAWVKLSILSNDGLGKRADSIDMWIKIAEKCRALNNFSSMVSIVAALSSQVIARLHLTWAHVGRGSHLEPLTRLNDPAGSFAAYRALHQSVDGSCVPFIAMYLTEIVHIQSQMPDNIVSPPTPENDALTLVCFSKRRRWYEVVHAVTRHQSKPYGYLENAPTVNFIESQLAAASGKDQGSFWQRSQEVQLAEVAHADIRKGLEVAGF